MTLNKNFRGFTRSWRPIRKYRYQSRSWVDHAFRSSSWRRSRLTKCWRSVCVTTAATMYKQSCFALHVRVRPRAPTRQTSDDYNAWQR